MVHMTMSCSTAGLPPTGNCGKGAKKKFRGEGLRSHPESGCAVVAGVKFIKRHTKANPQKNIKGGIIEREAPIHASNVMLVDPETNEATRIGHKTLPDGRRVRIGRKSGAVVDK